MHGITRACTHRGVSAEQDVRYINKEKKAMANMKFPKEYDQKVRPLPMHVMSNKQGSMHMQSMHMQSRPSNVQLLARQRTTRTTCKSLMIN